MRTIFALIAAAISAAQASDRPDRTEAYDRAYACAEWMESASAVGGGPALRSGTFSCNFRLEDPAHSSRSVIVTFEFNRHRYAPLDPDLQKLRDTRGTYLRSSLTIAGHFESKTEPMFEGAAQFTLMPRWEYLKAQSDAQTGADWPVALDKPRVRCDPNGSRCRMVLVTRSTESLVILALFDRSPDEPLETTAEALRQMTANW